MSPVEDSRKRVLDLAGIYFAPSVREQGLALLAANLANFEQVVSMSRQEEIDAMRLEVSNANNARITAESKVQIIEPKLASAELRNENYVAQINENFEKIFALEARIAELEGTQPEAPTLADMGKKKRKAD